MKLLAAADGYILPDMPPYRGPVILGINEKLMSDVIKWRFENSDLEFLPENVRNGYISSLYVSDIHAHDQ